MLERASSPTITDRPETEPMRLEIARIFQCYCDTGRSALGIPFCCRSNCTAISSIDGPSTRRRSNFLRHFSTSAAAMIHSTGSGGRKFARYSHIDKRNRRRLGGSVVVGLSFTRFLSYRCLIDIEHQAKFTCSMRC